MKAKLYEFLSGARQKASGCISKWANRVADVREVIASKHVEPPIGSKQPDKWKMCGDPGRDAS